MAVAIYTHFIEWGECDPAGIVFNPRFFEWFDAATANLLKQGGIDKAAMVKRWDVVIPLVETKAQFRRPSKWGEDITIESRVTEFGRSSFKVEHQLKGPGGEVRVIANEARVCCSHDPEDKDKLRPAAIPDEIAAIFKRFGGA